MYGIPKELDLSKAIGQFTTQFCVGAFDIQFELGDVHFAVNSEIRLKRDGEEIALWQEGAWPSQAFYEFFNIAVAEIKVVGDKEIAFFFEKGLSMHIYDNSDQYESMQIQIKGENNLLVI